MIVGHGGGSFELAATVAGFSRFHKCGGRKNEIAEYSAAEDSHWHFPPVLVFIGP
jgi:hypothetical protein